LGFALLAGFRTAHAGATPARIQALVDSADRRGLWKSPRWLALGRWHGREGAWDGDILGGYFYLDPLGRTDPRRELTATIRDILDSQDLSPYARDTTPVRMHPLVKFRARLRFLEDSLGILPRDLPPEDESRWLRWKQGIRPNRVVLVYASSYMGNPASLFGHALLRFDADDREGGRVVLDYGVAYGAAMPPGDPWYAVKGLLGLYPGYYTIAPYYVSLQKYEYLESRDLWEYPLLLDSMQVQVLLEHVWEEGAAWSRYLFFNGNCSNRILDLLDAVRPGSHLASELGFPAFPLEVVRLLQRHGLAGPPVWRPSILSVFRSRRDSLDPAELRRMRALVRGDTAFPTAIPEKTDSVKIAAAQDAALDFLNWKIRDADPKDRTGWLDRQGRILAQRVRFPPAEPFEPPPPPSVPEDAHRSWRAEFLSGEAGGGPWVGAGVRMAFHSLDDRPTGIPDGADVEALAADVRMPVEDPRGWTLRRLDAGNVLAAAPFDRDVPKPAWSLRFGLLPLEMAGQRTVPVGFASGIGLCLGDRAARVWALAEGRTAWAPWTGWDRFAAGPQARAGFLVLGGERFGWLAEGTAFRSLLLQHVLEVQAKSDVRWSFTRDLDLRVGGEDDTRRDWSGYGGLALHF
jgi:hypothetical protein